MLEKMNATAADRANYAIDGSGGYEETTTSIEGVGTIGQDVQIAPQDIAGFSPITTEAKVYQGGVESGVAAYAAGQFTLPIVQSGSELYIFYQRMNYNYRVHYYEYNTTTSLHTDTTGSAPFGTTVSQSPVSISGYTCVNPTPQNITIHDSEASNTVIFYYRENEYVVDYVAVTEDEGYLTPAREIVRGNNPCSGSVPTPKAYCSFVGWYKDAACTIPVTGTDGTVDPSTHRFTPDRERLSASETNLFYAKFVRSVGDLTIVRSGATESDQVFVYEVRSVDDPDYVIYVTVTGNGSATIKDLPQGNYTVTEQDAWSWRYSGAAETVEHNSSATTVSFNTTNSPKTSTQWLNGNSAVVTNRRGS